MQPLYLYVIDISINGCVKTVTYSTLIGLSLVTYQSSVTCKTAAGRRVSDCRCSHPSGRATNQQHDTLFGSAPHSWHQSSAGSLLLGRAQNCVELTQGRSSTQFYFTSTTAAKSVVLLLRFRKVPFRYLTRMWDIVAEESFRFRHSLPANPPSSPASHYFLLCKPVTLQLFLLRRGRVTRAYTTALQSFLDITITHTHIRSRLIELSALNNTQKIQKAKINAFSGIRTRDPSIQAAADLRKATGIDSLLHTERTNLLLLTSRLVRTSGN